MPKTKKKNDKLKHSAQAFRRNAPKEGRGGKGTWGNPMDDVEFLENPPPVAIDPNDPNYVPDENPDDADFDAWEEAVWHAEHETFDAYFDDYVEPTSPPTPADSSGELESVVRSGLDALLREELAPEAFVDHITSTFGKLPIGTGAAIAKCFFQPSLLDDEQVHLLARAAHQCVQKRTINMDQLDTGFLSALGDPQVPIDTLFKFGQLLSAEGVWTAGKVEEVNIVREMMRKLEAEGKSSEEFLVTLKAKTKTTIKEYFTSTDLDECVRCIQESCSPLFFYEVLKIVINLGMDSDSKCRELASQLIGQAMLFDSVSVRRGMEILIERLEDINLDVKDGTGLLACFIARAISDEAIPPSFVQEVAFQSLGASMIAIQCLQKIQHLLNMKLSAQRLSRVWGPGRGRPVDELKTLIADMLKEFFVAKDLNELANCLVDLKEPNFHHEFVKQSILKGADQGEDIVKASAEMLDVFVKKEVLTPHQVRLGVQRLVNGMDNYKCDTPLLPRAVSVVQQKLKFLGEEEVVGKAT